jgi:hypothetical protein
MAKITIRKGMPSVHLSKREFSNRIRDRFYDPAFDGLHEEIEKIIGTAWEAYSHHRKSPRVRSAGAGFTDPSFELSVEWLEARRAIKEAERRQKNPKSPLRILLINGSSRSDQTCPGEISKTFRLATIAREVFRRNRGIEVDFLDLSRLASEYGRTIHPCKACVSTAMPDLLP